MLPRISKRGCVNLSIRYAVQFLKSHLHNAVADIKRSFMKFDDKNLYNVQPDIRS